MGSPLTLAEKQPESPEKTYLIRQLSKQATIIKAQEAVLICFLSKGLTG